MPAVYAVFYLFIYLFIYFFVSVCTISLCVFLSLQVTPSPCPLPAYRTYPPLFRYRPIHCALFLSFVFSIIRLFVPNVPLLPSFPEAFDRSELSRPVICLSPLIKKAEHEIYTLFGLAKVLTSFVLSFVSITKKARVWFLFLFLFLLFVRITSCIFLWISKRLKSPEAALRPRIYREFLIFFVRFLILISRRAMSRLRLEKDQTKGSFSFNLRSFSSWFPF